MTRFININGRMFPADQAAVNAASRAFRYGYGLFETMLMQDGLIQLESYHWQRLFSGMQALYIDIPPHFANELKDAVRKTVTKNHHEQLCRIRLQVWPGSGGVYDDAFRTEYCVETFPLTEDILDLNQNGLVIGVADGVIKSADRLSAVKSCSAMAYSVAGRQAKTNKWNDALLLNQFGRIADSTIANIFWVKEGIIATPPISEGCVAGVMRRFLLEKFSNWGFTAREQTAPIETLLAADALFLTNSIRKLRWVSEYNGRRFDKGPAAAIHEKLLRSRGPDEAEV